jgi:membrane protein involved in colicin uptake
MISGISNTTTSTSTSSSSSSTTTDTALAQLKAELTAKQAALESAKTDDEKASINKEISALKASIAKAEAQNSGSSAKAGANNKSSAYSATVSVTQADKAAPESKMSGAAMDVLMRMGPGGGERPETDQRPDFSKLYNHLDADGDGSLTKEEFVTANAGRMGEDKASALFDAMDEEGTGTLSKEQFDDGMKKTGPGGPPPPAGYLPAFGSDDTDKA